MRLQTVFSRFGLSLVLVSSIGVGRVSAQTIRDTVKDHVGDELEGEGKEKRQKNTRKQPPASTQQTASPPPAPAGPPDPNAKTVSFSLTGEDLERSTRPPDKDGLPRRLFSDYLALDLKLDGAYRGWLPQQYDLVDVDVGGYYTYSVALRGKFFKYVNLHRGYYESNALAAPRNHEASVAVKAGSYVPKAAWLLGVIGFPILDVWEPVVRYEARSFDTTATPKAPVCIVNQDTSTSMDLGACPRTMQQLKVVSSFETLIVGVRYHSDKNSGAVIRSSSEKTPPVIFGLGLLSYNKPYQVTVGGRTLPDVLFDARFQGAGLALASNIGGGINRLFLDGDVQFGLGRVKLANDLTLNELAPEDWLIGYVQGNLTAGFRWAVIKGPPTVFLTPVLTAGGASFHFVNTKSGAKDSSDAPSLNWDFMWSGRLALEVAL